MREVGEEEERGVAWAHFFTGNLIGDKESMRANGKFDFGALAACVMLWLAICGGCRGLDGAPQAAGDRPAAPGVRLCVATDGNDAWTGCLAAANAGRSDGPLATLEASRQRIRELKRKGPLPAGGVEVVVRGGQYSLSTTFQLDAEDSGAADAPVVYRAAAGEKVCLVGGRPIKTRYFENLPGEDLRTLNDKELDAREWSRPKLDKLVEILPEMIKGYEAVTNQPAWQKMAHMDVSPLEAALSNGMIMHGQSAVNGKNGGGGLAGREAVGLWRKGGGCV